ncbi:hypothetical protein Hanom_Chr02g00170181 [Helianthus anomalus]
MMFRCGWLVNGADGSPDKTTGLVCRRRGRKAPELGHHLRLRSPVFGHERGRETDFWSVCLFSSLFVLCL